MRVVVIGATGHFGGRVCRRLFGHQNIELTVTSRSAESAEALATALQKQGPGTDIESAELDQTADSFVDDLAGLMPDVVAHTAGPYQGQGYVVAEACIELGCHYIDLADGREFVRDFGVLNERAVAAGVLLVAGASTLPGLSSAVIDEFRDRFSVIREIRTSIAPAHQTPRGAGTVAAVLSYCGNPVAVLEDGDWITRYGWQDMRVQRYPELGMRLSGCCDVPDLDAMTRYVEGVKTVTFHAALEAKWEQLALWIMAALTRMKLVRDWHRFMPAFQRMSDRLIALGSDTGGMQMCIRGRDKVGRPVEVRWDLTAKENHGPEIPCTPLLILIRRLAAGAIGMRGAYACTGLVSLAEFDAEVRDLDIHWTTLETR